MQLSDQFALSSADEMRGAPTLRLKNQPLLPSLIPPVRASLLPHCSLRTAPRAMRPIAVLATASFVCGTRDAHYDEHQAKVSEQRRTERSEVRREQGRPQRAKESRCNSAPCARRRKGNDGTPSAVETAQCGDGELSADGGTTQHPSRT